MFKYILPILITSSLFGDTFYTKDKISIGLEFDIGETETKDVTIDTRGSYTMFGANIEYFILNDISVGFGIKKWNDNEDYTTIDYSLPVTWYMPYRYKNIVPYIGGAYRYSNINDNNYEDLSILAARGGVSLISENLTFSIGWTQEYAIFDDYSNYQQGYVDTRLSILF